jgi:hypothetical protein
MNAKIVVKILLVCCLTHLSYSQSSVFVYQGQLIDHSQSANGLYDLQFRLADAATNGNYVGNVISNSNVSVNNGVFNVTLGFDEAVFDGSARWLEIGVRTNGSADAYTILQPLQPITTVPYATFASVAGVASVASNLVAGTVLTNLSVPGSSIQPGSITAAQLDPATDLAYRSLDTNAVTAIAASTLLNGANIQAGTVTSAQMDPATDLAYRSVNTNAVQAILGMTGISGSSIWPGTITPSQISPETDQAYRGTDTNAVAAIIAAASLDGTNIQAGTITSAQMDPATDLAYRSLNTNAVAAIMATTPISGSSILPGSVTSAQLDPATDLAYRRVDTNAVVAIVNTSSVNGANIQSGTITAAQIDPATDLVYRGVDTNAVTAIIAGTSINGSSIQAGTITAAQIDTNSFTALVMANSANTGGASPSRLNVKLVFGAKGDGITDDTAAIQAGLDALADVSASNVTLYLPSGTYMVFGTLSMPPTSFPNDPVLGINSGYRLSGAGLSATKLVWPSLVSGIGLALTNIVGYMGVTIEDLTLVGPLMSAWDPANSSIGMAIGKSGAETGWSGWNNTVRNCGLIGWGYGAAVTNQWGIVFDNCVVRSNCIEGLRFAGSHDVSVQNSHIGGGWSTACGIGVGFHPPMNLGYGDNGQIMNCLISNCTNGIVNNELALLSLNTHLEACGSYYTLLNALGNPSTTIIGGYTLDYNVPWTNGFAAQILMDPPSAARTVLQNCQLTSNHFPPRPIFNVINDGSGYAVPTYIGAGALAGLWNTTSNVTLYPFGAVPKPAKPIWTYQLPLRNGADFMSGIIAAQSPAPWGVGGAMDVVNGSIGALEFAIPYGMGFSNIVLELTVQGVDGETNAGFGMIADNYTIGVAGPQPCGSAKTVFNGITNGYTSTLYWTNSFAEDIFPRRCHYTITSVEDPQVGVTNDLWIVSWRLFSVETAGN